MIEVFIQQQVLVVDDDEAMRDSMKCLLESEKVACKIFASAKQFLEFCVPSHQGCILLDIRMPGMDGIELLENLKEQGIQMPVIIITGHGDVSLAVRAMKNGAFDFIQKPFKAQDLLGRVYAALALTLKESLNNLEQDVLRTTFEALTEREKEIMELVVKGSPSKVIGMKLGISNKTVESHRASIMFKLKVRNVAELVQMRLALLEKLN